jgi:hypothetical protein
MESVGSTTVQYIRCIKPNNEKSVGGFDSRKVVEQLRCAGVVAAIQMCRQTYPNHMKIKAFVSRFEAVNSAPALKSPKKASAFGFQLAENLQQKAASILDAGIKERRGSLPPTVKDDQPLYVFGKTLIFFTKGVLEAMEDIRIVHMCKCAVKIQTCARGKLQRLAFRRQFAGFVLTRRLQAWCRGCLKRKRFQLLRRAIIKAQTRYRGTSARKRVLTLRAERAAKAAEMAEEAQKELEDAALYTERMNVAATAAADKAWKRKKANKNLAKAQAREDAAKAAVENASGDAEAEQQARQAYLHKEEKMRQEAANAMEHALHYSEQQVEEKQEKVERFAAPAGKQGMVMDVVFELQDLGVHFWGAEVYKVAAGGQGANKGVIIGSKVKSVDGVDLSSGWQLRRMLQSASRPTVIRFQKPSVVDLLLTNTSASASPSAHPHFEKQNEYDVEFDEREMGVDLTQRKLVVTAVHPAGQGEEKGVKVGSRVIKVEGDKVNGLDSLATMMQSVGRPVTLTFREKKETGERAKAARPSVVEQSTQEDRGRRTMKRSSLERKKRETKVQQDKMKESTDEKAYVAWLYGKDAKRGAAEGHDNYLKLLERSKKAASAQKLLL